MRYHSAFGELAVPFGDGTLRETVSAESLVAARFEPVLRAGKGCGVVDLLFRKGLRRVGIPLVIVDVAMLEARERDPLVWPKSVFESGIDDFAIARRVEGWIGELFAAGRLNLESWNIFGDASDSEAFGAAREAGFLGASPLEDVARRAAPYVFARRHAFGRDVVIAARDAGLGAVLLARTARRVRVVDDAQNSAGLAWYAPRLSDARADVAIVDAPHREASEGARVVIDIDDAGVGEALAIEPAPIVPLDVLFDFTGTVHGTEPRFSIVCRDARPSVPPVVAWSEPIGGSTGRIVFVLRRGAHRFGGADVDLAECVAETMRSEGFTVGVIEDPFEIAAFRPDLIHAFGVADAGVAAACQRTAAAMEIPFAIHPLYDACGLGGYWGATVTPYCYRFMQDESMVLAMLQLLAARRLAVNEVRADAPFHPANPRWESDVRTAVSGAHVVYVSGAAELDAVRRFGIEGEAVIVPPPCAPLGEAAGVDALVGGEPYILMHAPIESTQNQLQAVRAARVVDLPLVVAGPVADPDYAALVRAFAGERTVIVGEPDAATVEGLYRGAKVFLDAAWVGCGLARAARAFSRGAALAISARLPAADLDLGPFVHEVDPGRIETIARGLGDAWYRSQEEPREFEERRRSFAERAEVREVTRRIVAGYAKALDRRNSAALR